MLRTFKSDLRATWQLLCELVTRVLHRQVWIFGMTVRPGHMSDQHQTYHTRNMAQNPVGTN